MANKYYCPRCGGTEKKLYVVEMIDQEDEIKEVCACDHCSVIVNVFSEKERPGEEAINERISARGTGAAGPAYRKYN